MSPSMVLSRFIYAEFIIVCCGLLTVLALFCKHLALRVAFCLSVGVTYFAASSNSGGYVSCFVSRRKTFLSWNGIGIYCDAVL